MVIGAVAVAVAAVAFTVFHKPALCVEDILALYQDRAAYSGLTISYPENDTLFPPEIAPPIFRWDDDAPESDTWLITIKFQDNNERLNFLTQAQQWAPNVKDWKNIKTRSLEKQAEIAILGVRRSKPDKVLSGGRITIKTSKDKVDAPLFYREVNLPFIDAVKDPSRIRWRFGAISSLQQPPVVLENLPVCGNCHSFPRDGKILAMDVDYANSKASYVITQVAQEMALATSDIITWSDYRREDAESTFGLLSQVSPDGRYVVSTVKDESVFVPRPDLAFSQLFFPVKGILCIYDRQTDTFSALPGADDPQYVQSNPTWSPDGRHIVFARAEAYKLERIGDKSTVLLTPEECREFLEEGKLFLFDLYKIPFNDGKGGTPVPLEGASGNGMSNFFAKYSPDGKWIVFCKAKSYMLLQPDSELYIIPAEGGKARRLRCNTSRMNSWHSWSPNGKWLVFSSKANSDYTQLFLAHIDEQGRSTPAVLLSRFTAPDRAANIPEFVNTKPSAIKKIHEHFLDDYSFVRIAIEKLQSGDLEGAEPACRKALELNPKSTQAYDTLAHIFSSRGVLEEAVAHWLEVIRLDPNHAGAHYNIGVAMIHQRKANEALRHLSKAVQLRPEHAKAHANLASVLLAEGMPQDGVAHLFEAIRLDPDCAEAHYNLGKVMFRQGKLDAAIQHWSKVVRIRPQDVDAHYELGEAFARQGKTDKAISHWSEVIRLDPNSAPAHYNLGIALTRQGKIDVAIAHWLEVARLDPNNADALMNLATSYAKTGRFQEAVLFADKALNRANAAGNEKLAQRINAWIVRYKQAQKSLKGDSR